MASWDPYRRPLDYPIKSLTLLFVFWKILLLLVAAASPLPGYDTSTVVLLRGGTLESGGRRLHPKSCTIVDRLSINLVRWDSIYFVKAAERGYVYEQEWAFSWTFTRVINSVAQSFFHFPANSLRAYVWTGVIISHFAHFLSVLVLHRLFITIRNVSQSDKTSFAGATLHIVSPAGLFLSAPYSESLFSLLNFTGMLLYAKSRKAQQDQSSWRITQDYFLLSSGGFFALAASVRSNGLLSGLIFVYDVATLLPTLMTSHLNLNEFRRLAATTIAGALVAIGFIVPQWLAYNEYCGANISQNYVRPWCTGYLPSIYSWVQSYYWDVGFFRYWSLSNVPLFLIAAPMLWLLFQSGAVALRNPAQSQANAVLSHSGHGSMAQSSSDVGNRCVSVTGDYSLLRRLAVPQLVLALMALTNFHVQIINRISSGYAIWYLGVAASTLKANQFTSSQKNPTRIIKWAVRWSIVYAIVQGGLFASFLPPA
ncbi:glycosyltransferase family 76 protein [Lepidopterella palustris CBS 459.81]|uniref:GPI mannosyltransferase 2 n=1 Tax=Lepidopterella palustris CBS 459.81 TaxID=1314670 RepID=A0A8E2EJH9_9PEZI|nr:glycosyltransferase family 76 protein [Lepidopterella palustris CBS 459.81]